MESLYAHLVVILEKYVFMKNWLEYYILLIDKVPMLEVKFTWAPFYFFCNVIIELFCNSSVQTPERKSYTSK